LAVEVHDQGSISWVDPELRPRPMVHAADQPSHHGREEAQQWNALPHQASQRVQRRVSRYPRLIVSPGEVYRVLRIDVEEGEQFPQNAPRVSLQILVEKNTHSLAG